MDVDELRATLSAWLTLALDFRHGPVSDEDLFLLRDWIDNGCPGEAPMPD